MHLYKKSKVRNIESICNQLQKASGICENSQRLPLGFDTVVNFDFGTVYVDDNIFTALDKVSQEIDECLMRLLKGDYGICSVDEIDQNNECKWLGNGQISAKYIISLGVIQIDKQANETLIILRK